MKKIIFTLSFAFTLAILAVHGQSPLVKLSASSQDSGSWYSLEIDRLDEVKSLELVPQVYDSSPFKIISAQFIFAPKHGDPRLVSFKGPELPQTVLYILQNHGAVGDRIIVDRIRVEHKGLKRTLMPFVCGIVQTQTPHAQLQGSVSSSQTNGIIELDDLKNSRGLELSGIIEGDNWQLQSAQFVLAPKKGEAKLVRMHEGQFRESVYSILNNDAKVGDRVIFDKITALHDSSRVVLLPLLYRIAQAHYFSEDSIASEDIDLSKRILGVNGLRMVRTEDGQSPSNVISYNKAHFISEPTGTVNYYDELGGLIGSARFENGILQKKEYYFPGSKLARIRATLELDGEVYSQQHYDSEGYLVAKGEVAYTDSRPINMLINPLGLEGSPLSNLQLISEYRPQGNWTVYDKDGGSIFSAFVLSWGDESHSTKFGENNDGPKSKVIKKKGDRKSKPKKYRSIGNPWF
jgi:hypothetical protein